MFNQILCEGVLSVAVAQASIGTFSLGFVHHPLRAQLHNVRVFEEVRLSRDVLELELGIWRAAGALSSSPSLCLRPGVDLVVRRRFRVLVLQLLPNCACGRRQSNHVASSA